MLVAWNPKGHFQNQVSDWLASCLQIQAAPNLSSPPISSMTITTLHGSPEQLQCGPSYSLWWSTGNTHHLYKLYTIPHWTCLSSTASYLAVLPRMSPASDTPPPNLHHLTLVPKSSVRCFMVLELTRPCARQAITCCWATSPALVSHPEYLHWLFLESLTALELKWMMKIPLLFIQKSVAN